MALPLIATAAMQAAPSIAKALTGGSKTKTSSATSGDIYDSDEIFSGAINFAPTGTNTALWVAGAVVAVFLIFSGRRR